MKASTIVWIVGGVTLTGGAVIGCYYLLRDRKEEKIPIEDENILHMSFIPPTKLQRVSAGGLRTWLNLNENKGTPIYKDIDSNLWVGQVGFRAALARYRDQKAFREIDREGIIKLWETMTEQSFKEEASKEIRASTVRRPTSWYYDIVRDRSPTTRGTEDFPFGRIEDSDIIW